MVAGRDSSFSAPSLAQAQQAYVAGIRCWGGYLATQQDVGLAAPWPQAAFQNVQQAGMQAIAFCSGWDNPIALRNLAQRYNVLLCLDVEAGIRGIGDWIPNFISASGAGLYGGMAVHAYAAPFHILAAYPGSDPKATWPSGSKAPNTPRGWQYEGSHIEFGLEVDSGWYDDWFAAGGNLLLTEGMKIGLAHVALKAIYQRQPTEQEMFDFANSLNADGSNYNDLVQGAANQLQNADLVRIQSETLAASLDGLKQTGLIPHKHPLTGETDLPQAS